MYYDLGICLCGVPPWHFSSVSERCQELLPEIKKIGGGAADSVAERTVKKRPLPLLSLRMRHNVSLFKIPNASYQGGSVAKNLFAFH